MMCTMVIRDVADVLIFDIIALLIRGAVTFVGNDSAIRIDSMEIRAKKREIKSKKKKKNPGEWFKLNSNDFSYKKKAVLCANLLTKLLSMR